MRDGTLHFMNWASGNDTVRGEYSEGGVSLQSEYVSLIGQGENRAQ